MLDEPMRFKLFRVQSKLSSILENGITSSIRGYGFTNTFLTELNNINIPMYGKLFSSAFTTNVCTIQFNDTEILINDHYESHGLCTGTPATWKTKFHSKRVCKLYMNNNNITVDDSTIEITDELQFYFEFVKLENIVNCINKIKQQVKYYEYKRFSN